MAELRLRRYRPADAPAVRRLHLLGLHSVDGLTVVRGPHDADVRDVERHYLDAGGEFLVGERGDLVVACGGFRPVDQSDTGNATAETRERQGNSGDELVVEIARMRVDPVFQRLGYGRRLLHELERRARERGATRATLHTTGPQTAARRLYGDEGYDVRERVERNGLAVYFFEKTL